MIEVEEETKKHTQSLGVDEDPLSKDSDAEPNADADGNQAEGDEAAQEELAEKLRREREARAQALTLEIVGDLPFAEVKPPENVLFVCKLNPVTEGQALLVSS